MEELHGVLFSFRRCIDSISLPQYAPHNFARLFMLMLTVRELLYSLASIARILARAGESFMSSLQPLDQSGFVKRIRTDSNPEVHLSPSWLS